MGNPAVVSWTFLFVKKSRTNNKHWEQNIHTCRSWNHIEEKVICQKSLWNKDGFLFSYLLCVMVLHQCSGSLCSLMHKSWGRMSIKDNVSQFFLILFRGFSYSFWGDLTSALSQLGHGDQQQVNIWLIGWLVNCDCLCSFFTWEGPTVWRTMQLLDYIASQEEKENVVLNACT